ncbi:MAG: hypothetical protein NT040_02175 [Bacteroidetes bacterium]|nr:hypothetical protein [Bacteroidota bacterium]
MKKTTRFIFIMAAMAVLSVSTPVKAQFITIARKIKTMHTGQADIATVIIDARTHRVYQAVTDTLASNPKFKITSRNNAENTVVFNVKTYTVTMKVDSLANGLTQITVSAAPPGDTEKKATSMAVEAIMGVCKKAGITCTLDKK